MKKYLWILVAMILVVQARAACNICDGENFCGTDYCCSAVADGVCPEDFGDWSSCPGNHCQNCDWDCDSTPPSYNGPVYPPVDTFRNANPVNFDAGTCSDACLGVESYAIAYADVPTGTVCTTVPGSTYDLHDTGWQPGHLASFTLQDGHDYCVRLKCRDLRHNTNSKYSVGRIRMDLSAPDTTINSGPSAWVNVAQSQFTFSCSQPPCTFQCKVDSGPYASCSSPDTTASQAEGNHLFSVFATDGAGNTDLSPATWPWGIDMTGPDTSLKVGNNINENNTVVDDGFAWATMTNVDPLSGVASCLIRWGDGGQDFLPPAQATIRHQYVADGTYAVEYNCTDVAGNPSGISRVDVVVATAISASSIVLGTISDCSGSSEWSPNGQVYAHLFPSAGSTFCSISWDAGISWIPDFPQTEVCKNQFYGAQGLYVVLYHCRNNVGQWDAVAAQDYIIVDWTKPALTLNPILPNPINNNNLDYTGIIIDSPPEGRIGTVEYSIDGPPRHTASADDGTFDGNAEGYHFSIPGVSDGMHNVTAFGADQVGHQADQVEDHILVDTGEPNTLLIAPPTTTTANPTFVGQSNDALTAIKLVEYRLDGAPYGPATGVWGHNPQAFTIPLTNLAEGGHTLLVRATDNASNVESTPFVHAFTVDATGPVVSVLGIGPVENISSSFIQGHWSGPNVFAFPTAWWRADENASTCTINWNSTDLINDATFPAGRLANEFGTNFIIGYRNSSADGEYRAEGNVTVSLFCNDALGNKGAANTANTFIDATGPTIESLSYPEYTRVRGLTVQAVVNDHPPGGVVMDAFYNLSGPGGVQIADWTEILAYDGLYNGQSEQIALSLTLPDQDGIYTLSILGIDRANNPGPIAVVNIYLDRTPPTVNFTPPLPPDNPAQVVYHGWADDTHGVMPTPVNVTYTVWYNGVLNISERLATPMDGSFNSPLEEYNFTFNAVGNGIYGVNVTATDAAGLSATINDDFLVSNAGLNFFIQGYVWNTTVGNALNHSKIRFLGRFPDEVYANEDGSYFSYLHDGETYTVVASHPGFAPQIVNNILMDQDQFIDFTLQPASSLCRADCTMGDDICHAECEGWNDCSFASMLAASACDQREPGFRVQWDPLNYPDELVRCCIGKPYRIGPATFVDLNTSAVDRSVRVTRIVRYAGQPVRLIIDVVER